MIPTGVLSKIEDIINEFFLINDLNRVNMVGSRLTGYYREDAPYEFIYSDDTLENLDDEYKIGRYEESTGSKIGLIRRNPGKLFDLNFDLPVYNLGTKTFTAGSKEGILEYWNDKLTISKERYKSLFFKNKLLYSNIYGITEEDINNLKQTHLQQNA